MKYKFIALAAAAALVSCSAKPAVPEEPVEDAPETPTAPQIRELTAEDFKKVNINLNKVEFGEMVTTERYELDDIFVNGVKSPCTESDLWKEIADEYRQDEWFIEANLENALSLVGKESVPWARCTTLSGDKLYFIADYDNFCENLGKGSHCLMYCEYDLTEGVTRELGRWEDIGGKVYNIDDMCFFDGAVWTVHSIFTNERRGGMYIRRFDPETGKSEQISADVYQWGFQDAPDRLVYGEYTDPGVRLHQWDCENDCWVTLCDVPSIEYVVTKSGVVYSDTDENGSCIIYGDGFRLDTGEPGIFSAAGSCMATVSVPDTNLLHVYDFDSMECLQIDLSPMGSEMTPIADGDNLLIMSSSGRYVNYLMPRIGCYFSLYPAPFSSEEKNVYAYGLKQLEDSSGFYIYVSNGYYSVSDENGFTILPGKKELRIIRKNERVVE